MKAVIAGAGIGGLTTALCLLQRGWDVVIAEQAPALAEVGAGITITPNADRVFTALGLQDALAQHAVIPQRQWTQQWDTGALIKDVERGASTAQHYGAGYYHIHRADLHQVLVDAVEARAPGSITLAAAAQSASADGVLTLSSGATLSGDVVIGADGLKSQIRESAFEADTPQFTGQVAWRGLVPSKAVPADKQLAEPGIHVGPKQLFMRYPVRARSLTNYAAFVNTGGWAEEGWTIPSSRAELLTYFGDWDPAVVALINATPDDQLFKWALFVRSPLTTWVNGRVTLVGDAAHAMLPFMGQGAATAIEDGMILARALDAYGVEAGLSAYDKARRTRTDAIQENARLLGQQFQGGSPDAIKSGSIKNEEELGLFDYDAVTVEI